MTTRLVQQSDLERLRNLLSVAKKPETRQKLADQIAKVELLSDKGEGSNGNS